ncbi:pyridoxal phosphate-dependent aminotransferase [[Eubacterium] cellulosolvens]
MLSHRIGTIEPSATLAIDTKVKELKKRGEDVIDFGVGEPDLPTPQNIKAAAIKAIHEDFTYYTPPTGIIELKQAIAKKLEDINNVVYSPSQIALSCGGKHSLYNILLAAINPEDEVILPKPFWVSYIEQIKLVGGTAVIADTDNDLKIRADLLREKITDKTKLIILNSPSNPSAMICDDSELKRIADLVCENNLSVISDEVYEYFVYDGKKHVSIASLNEEIKERTIISNSVSKTYSMTGWRIGYTAGPLRIIRGIDRLQSHTTSNPTSIAQKAALEALTGPQESIAKMLKIFTERRKFIIKRINELNTIVCSKPEGAFYIFPNISEAGLNSIEFTNQLLEEEQVAVIPGIAFGQDTNIRLSYAKSIEEIKEGMDRMESFCDGL